MKQTAVEWFFDKIKSHFEYDVYLFETTCMTYAIAKKMEKEQHQETWDVAHQAGRFEGKGIAEENWQTFEGYWEEKNK